MRDAPTGSASELAELARLPELDDGARSHRAVVGPLVDGLKRVGRAVLRRLAAPWLERQQRFNQRVAELLAAPPPDPASGADDAELRRLGERLEVVHETLTREITMRESALRRDLEQGLADRVTGALAALAGGEGAAADPAGEERALEVLGDQLYRSFEDRFRGSPAEVRERLAGYLDDFRGRAPVLDVGCGRGEFLGLLAEQGVEARGVDRSPEMVRICLDAGLDVTCADALGHLHDLPESSLGGIFSAQFVEHLEPADLRRFLVLARRALAPGGVIVLETVNVESLVALTRNYFADWTHRTPVGPSTLRFLAAEVGFADPGVRYLSELPEHARLERVPVTPALDTTTRSLVEAVNRNVERLNALLYGPQDFALIARKP